jgi:hypothetical protein
MLPIKSTITFEGTRSVSLSGNVEHWSFEITSTRALSKKTIESICSSHGCGGQSFSYQTTQTNQGFTYTGSATSYSD